jgi:arylsulfatase A-like enzyme
LAKHPKFLITVFDSLRPDMVTPERAPNLVRFMAEGCHFTNSRAIFPTSTYTNSVALATGATVRNHGILGNRFFDPNIFDDRLFQPSLGEHIDAGQRAYGGRLYTTPSLGDVLAAAGYRTAVVVGGSPGTARPMDPRAGERDHINLAFNGWEHAVPSAVAEALIEEFGPIPPVAVPNFERIRLQTDLVIEAVYPRYEPDVAVIWFTDPDQTYHYCGLASAETDQAIRHVDKQFGRILDWRAAAGLEERLHVIATSDHGHLTTIKKIDVNREAAKAGLAIGDHFNDGADYAGYTSYSGGVVARDGDGRRKADLVDWLMEQPWCGMVFTGGGNGVEGSIPGTFDYGLVQMDHPRMPDVSYVMRNDDVAVANGIAGRCYYNGVYPEGGGTHGGLHPKELNNLFIAQGPLFRSGHVSDHPAGIIDIAPTILHALGIAQPATMDGRVLVEALADGDGVPPDAETVTQTAERAGRVQHLRYTRVGTTTYLDAGWVEDGRGA